MSEQQRHFSLMASPDVTSVSGSDAQQVFSQAQRYKMDGTIASQPNELPLLEEPNATWVIAAALPSGLRATMRVGYENGKPQLRFGIVIPREIRRTPELLAQTGSVTLTEDQQPVMDGIANTKGDFIRAIVDAIQETTQTSPKSLLVNVYSRN